MKKTGKVLFELGGRNYWRYFSLITLLGITGFSVYLIHLLGYVILLATVSTVFLLSAIRFPVLYLHNEFLVIERNSIFKKFSEKEMIEFHKIKSVRFSKSHTNWSRLILQTLLGQGGSGGFTRSDRMIISMKDGSSRIYNRFGSRENFKKAIRLIRKKII